MKSFVLSIGLLLSVQALAETPCTKTWPEVLNKVKDLRKMNDCSPQYSLKECQANLGLLGVAGAAGAGAKKLQRKPPAACGLYSFEDLQIQETNSFWAFVLQAQIPKSLASNSCFKTFDSEKKEIEDLIKKQKEAIKAEIEKSSETEFAEASKKHSELSKLHAEKAQIMEALDNSKGPFTPSQLKDAVAKMKKIDEKISDYVQNFTARSTSSDAKEEIKALNEALEKSARAGKPEVGMAHFAAARGAKSANALKLIQLRDQLEGLTVVEKAIAGSASYLPANFAKALEAAANHVPQNMIDKIAEIRMRFAQKYPDISMSRSSKLAIYGFRNEFDKGNKRLVAKPKGLMKLAGGVGGMVVSGITLASEKTTEGRTDALSDMTFSSSTACDEKNSQWVEVDGDCRTSKEWNSGIATFVDLDEASIKSELDKDNGRLCKHLMEMHQKYFSSNTQASCNGNSVIIKDHTNRQNYTASWDDKGEIQNFKYNGDFLNNKEYQIGFNRGSMGSVDYSGGTLKKRLPAAALKKEAGNFMTANFADHFSKASPRVMELQGCCMGKISDDRCSPLRGSGGGGGSSSGNGGRGVQ